MTRGQKRSLVRRGHAWLGVLLAVLLLVVAGSGILLQHPRWLGPPLEPVLSLAADPSDPERLFRGSRWGVEVSVDGGGQWREVNMLAPPTDVGRILFAPDAKTVYALGVDALVVSADAGHVWQEVHLPAEVLAFGARPVDLAIGPAGRVQLLTTMGLYRRSAGDHWTRVGPATATGRDRYRWLHDLHTGQLGGPAGRRLAEGAAWGLVLLTVTGLVLQRRGRRRGQP